MPLLSDVTFIFFKSLVVLTSNGRFLDYATIAFSERLCDLSYSKGHQVCNCLPRHRFFLVSMCISSAAARLPRLWVRIPPGPRMSVMSCVDR